MGIISAPVKGMRVLNQAAIMYTATSTRMAACGPESMPVSIRGRSNDNSQLERAGPTSCPPTSTPRMMEAMVRPSIQPLALTS
ncbi:MAG: hypothetical protein RJA29_1960 [Pseudomonadota bacterium]